MIALPGTVYDRKDLNFLDFVKSASVEFFHDWKEMPPHVFMEVRKDANGEELPEGSVLVLLVPPETMADKDRLVDAIRAIAKKSEASHVAIVAEMWEVVTPHHASIEEMEEARDRMPENLGDHPDAKESVSIFFETKMNRRFISAGVEHVDGSKVLTPWIERDSVYFSGRFTSILPVSKRDLC